MSEAHSTPRISSEQFTSKQIASFWARVSTDGLDVCWPWMRCCTRSGYGQVRFSKQRYRTSRLAYCFTRGEVPEDTHVLHSCDNPPCCNPTHLFSGNHQANMTDAVNKGRIPVGEANGRSKIDSDKAKEMRLLHSLGWSFVAIAVFSDVTVTTVRSVVFRRTWRHVPE